MNHDKTDRSSAGTPEPRRVVASPGAKCYLPDSRESEAMGLALAEGEKALRLGEVPVGAVLLWNGKVLASAHNLRETRADPLAHAEMLVIAEAARTLGRWRLDAAVLVVTLEPCPMCMGAILQARIPLLVYGASDPKAGAAGSLYDLSDDPRLNHRVEVRRGLKKAEASALLREFFEARRGREATVESQRGEVSEWSMVPDSKSGVRKRT